MHVEHLVTMANQIGKAHEALPDHREAVDATAGHIRRFWDPRMRRALYDHLDAGGDGLEPLVLEALKSHRAEIEPRQSAAR